MRELSAEPVMVVIVTGRHLPALAGAKGTLPLRLPPDLGFFTREAPDQPEPAGGGVARRVASMAGGATASLRIPVRMATSPGTSGGWR